MSLLLVIALSSIAHAARKPSETDTLFQRFEQLKPRAAELFHDPQSEQDKAFRQAGVMHYWTAYGKTPLPDPAAFKGYVILGDPFHVGLKKITFQKGSDCTHFVHRLYQLMGAEFPYAKTRQLLIVARAQQAGGGILAYLQDLRKKNEPVDRDDCFYKQLDLDFELVKKEDAKLGDFILFAKGRGVAGEKGHVAVLKSLNPPILLHAHNAKAGITEEDFALNEDFMVLRWRGTLKTLAAADVKSLLQLTWTADVKPAACGGDQ